MQKFLNNFETTFVASVKDSPGTANPATELDYGILRLSDGAAAFLTNPGPGDFYVLTAYKRDGTIEVNQEIMKVTAVDNTQPGECRITVERGREGTTVRSYLAGDRISLRLTAGAVQNWVAQFAIAENNANIATNQANIATNQANIATTKADNATAQADRAATAAANADADRIAAQDAAAAAAASYDAFDDRYLGSKSADPTLDNDGNALIEGALYWNTTVKEMRTYNGTAWVTTSVANAVSRGGDTMTGPLSVPAGATGAQAPQVQEVLHHTFPSGTKMLFAQTTAPTGWTKDTTHNNKALRVVTGTAGSGGTVGFTTAFASKAVSGTVENTTLSEAQMPSHRHGAEGGVLVTNVYPNAVSWAPVSATGNLNMNGGATAFTGGGGSHNHTFTGTAIDLAVQYVDVIIATKA